MYLDTDIILAFIKPKDWLKPYVKIKEIENPRTSTFSVIEAEIILSREYDRKDIFAILDKLKKSGIEILSFDEKILEKSIELMEKYPRLHVFDSVHAAFSANRKEKILSTDLLFDTIEGVERIDPRELK